MASRDIVVIGGSAGAIPPLRRVLSDLPADLPAALFVAIHLSPNSPAALGTMLAHETRLAVSYARDGRAIRRGHVFVAPPDHHLLIAREQVLVTRGPRENGFRPAVDPLFRTAAAAYGPRVIGIVLSGELDDGTRGLARIKRAGGVAVVRRRTMRPRRACRQARSGASRSITSSRPASSPR